jgi:hypothetical protein
MFPCGERVIVTVCALAFLTSGCKPSHDIEGTRKKSATQSEWFADVTSKSGLTFVHDAEAKGEYFMPESVGSGGTLFDFDNDGRLDVYLVHCVGTNSASHNQLFQQQTDGTFRNVSAGSGLDVNGRGMGVAAADANNDGRTDVLLTEYGRARLFLNRGAGKFEDVSATAGVDNTRWGTSATFCDYDRDGWLDIVIANYLDYSPTDKCFDTRGAQEFCGPQGMLGTAARLFRNLGASNGAMVRFVDETVRSGIARNTGPALGVVCADFTGDRWPDIFFADDGQPNRLFVNQHDGTFTEEAVSRGLAYTMLGGTAGNMGVTVGDVNGDELLDIFVTHLSWEHHTLWQQGPRGVFQDRSATAGLTAVGWRGTGFGTALIDFDLDGAEDLAFVNGRIKRGDDPAPRLPGLAPFWFPYAQRNQLLANEGSGRFRDISGDNPAFCGVAAVGRALLSGDIDNDGDVDLIATTAGGPVRLFQNVATRRGHWLSVRTIDPTPGERDAVGAEVTVRAGGKRYWRLVQPGTGYLTSNDPRAHFGLGGVATFDDITVIWPDGAEEHFGGGNADQFLILKKGAGRK